jgi:anti-sigma B factor antagonist
VHRIDVDENGGATVVAASGELDAFVADDLTDAFARTLQVSRIVVDLASVSFMDSTALGILVRTVREVDEREGEIRVVLPTGSARRIFEITTLDRVLPVSGSLSEALSELARGRGQASV